MTGAICRPLQRALGGVCRPPQARVISFAPQTVTKQRDDDENGGTSYKVEPQTLPGRGEWLGKNWESGLVLTVDLVHHVLVDLGLDPLDSVEELERHLDKSLKT